MNTETFAEVISRLGGPLAAARLIVQQSGIGEENSLRVQISRKVNGHERVTPTWAIVALALDKKRSPD